MLRRTALLVVILTLLPQVFCTTKATPIQLHEASSAIDLAVSATTLTNSTVPVAERRTDEYFHGLETTNSQYNPSPSPQPYSPTTLSHQDQLNYVSDLLRQYNPGGGYGDPYSTYFDFPQHQDGQQVAQTTGPNQQGLPPGSGPPQGSFNPGSFGQNFPLFGQLPSYAGNPNFGPRPQPPPPPPAQSSESSEPAPTRATGRSPVPNEVNVNNYYNASPFPPTPSFPTFTFPAYNNNYNSSGFSPPPDFGSYGSFGQFPHPQPNLYPLGNSRPGENPDLGRAPSPAELPPQNPGFRPPPNFQDSGFRVSPNFQGFPNYPQQPLPQGVPLPPPPPSPQGRPSLQPDAQEFRPNSNAQPTATTRTQEDADERKPANEPNPEAPRNNQGQFEGFHPNYPYGPPATIPSGLAPLRPGSEYGYNYNPPVFQDNEGSNGTSQNAPPFPGYVGYPVYANLPSPPNTNQIPGGYFGQEPPGPPPPPPYQRQPPREFSPPEEPIGEPQRGPPTGGHVLPNFPPPRVPQGGNPLPPPPQLRRPPPRLQGYRDQGPPRLPDNYGDQQPPGTQGRAPYRDLRRRPLSPGFFDYDPYYLPQEAPVIDYPVTPAPTALLGKLKRRGQVVTLRGDRPACSKTTNVTFCLEDPDYPRDKVKKALESSSSFLDLLYKDSSGSKQSPVTASSSVFGARILPSEDMKAQSDESHGLSLDDERKRSNDLNAPCPSSVHYARPLRALSAKGEWKVIVNMQDQKFKRDQSAEQIVRLDVCSQPSTPCSYSGSSSESAPSRCLQKRKLHRLLAWTESSGLHQENFYLPVACSCFISN